MHDVSFICTSLVIISELMKEKSGLMTMLTSPKDLSKDEAYPYDVSKRDRCYSGAESTCLWELTALLYHFYPTVVSYAKLLLTNQLITCAVDPLQHFTAIKFLDRLTPTNETT